MLKYCSTLNNGTVVISRGIGYNQLNYPFGEYIATNYPFVSNLCDFFIEVAWDNIKQRNINFIGRGSSGAMISTIFYQKVKATALNSVIHLLHIKKQGEASHYKASYAFLHNSINIFVDDFVCTGETFEQTLHTIREESFDLNFVFDFVVVAHVPKYSLQCLFGNSPVCKTLIY